MEKKRTMLGDFTKEAILGGLVASPAFDIGFKVFGKVPFKQAFKESFATVKGWKSNALWAGAFGVITVAFNAMMGRYKQQPEAAPAPMVAEQAPTPVLEQAPQAGNFAKKETARREEAAEQSAQVG